jgi:sec-independent protein translocase protein TatA
VWRLLTVRFGGVMGEFSPFHWLLVIAIALLLFGTSKFAAVGKGLGEGIRNFKASMKEPDADKKEEKKEEEKKQEEKKS